MYSRDIEGKFETCVKFQVRDLRFYPYRRSIRSTTLLSHRRYRRVLSAPEPRPIARRTLGPNKESPSTRIKRCVAAKRVSSKSGTRRPSFCTLRPPPAEI